MLRWPGPIRRPIASHCPKRVALKLQPLGLFFLEMQLHGKARICTVSLKYWIASICIIVIYYWLRSGVSRALTANGLVYGNPPFSTTTESTEKIVTGDYVHDFYRCAKFGRNPSMGASGQTDEITTQNFYTPS